jgi:hypothetical protein
VDLYFRGDEVKGSPAPVPSVGDNRGNPKIKDWYYFTGLHFIFRLNVKEEKGYLGKGNTGCPRF